jgi:hypothetical protein
LADILIRLSLVCVLLACAAACCSDAKPAAQVGVYYFPGWYNGKPGSDSVGDWSEWRACIAKCPKPRPMCGFYDDSDPRLWSYYVDWMTNYGVDFLAFDWYYNAGKLGLNDSLDKGFLGCEVNTKVKFALHWCNHPLGWWTLDQSRPELLKMTDLCCERYFNRPNYLRVDGKPVFMIYDISQLLAFGGFDGVKSSLRAMRGRAMRAGVGDLYLVAVYSGVSAPYAELCRDLGFDSFCAYTYVGTRYPPLKWDSLNIPYDTSVASCTENIYPFLSRMAREKGISYWPTTFPGWDDRPRAGVEKAFVTSGNTPELFGKMFRGALKHTDPASPIVMVEAWNEWGEGACIEPDKQHGFGWLEQIAKALGCKPGKPKVPTAEEIASWSRLTPEEIAAAKAIEENPWEPKPPVYLDMGKNRSVPPVKLPTTLDLAEGGAHVQVAGGKIEKRDANGLVFLSDSIDPMVFVDTKGIPTDRIKRITLCSEADPGSTATVSIELFFVTALYPSSSPFTSAQLGPLRPGKMSIETSEIMGWERFGTPLTAIRIDPGQESGAKVLLKKLVLE